jgi:hypothetical protein
MSYPKLRFFLCSFSNNQPLKNQPKNNQKAAKKAAKKATKTAPHTKSKIFRSTKE